MSELADFGLPATLTLAQVKQASALIDGFLSRPEGLVWSPDAAGTPAYMAALPTALSLAGAGPISPGANVVVPYVGPSLDNNNVGETLLLDRVNGAAVESCIIQAVNTSPNSVVLTKVLFAHADACTMEFGLSIMEQKEMPKDRSTTLLSKFPIWSLQSGVGRYGYARRSAQVIGAYQDFNLLAIVSNFGGPPLWIPWATANASINRKMGELWVPAGILLAYYTEVKVWYIAGYSVKNLPFAIKQACANILNVIKETGLGANIRRRDQVGGTATSKFENNLIDVNTREMLRPFAARNLM
jgi:hypothetical protein